jgi:YfiH family protein
MQVHRATNLDHCDGVVHGFFGRRGGVSTGLFASLNCGPGSGDDRANVLANRDRAVQALLPGATLLTLYQIHGADTAIVDGAWAIGEAPRADAMATKTKGFALGVLTADCAPVLFADASAGVVAAAHAGWKGALAGVIESAVSAMEKLGASRARIAAAIGPCVGQEHYEVGPEFRERFVEASPDYARFFLPAERSGHCRFDLEGFVALRLEGAGVFAVERLQACTYARDRDFFSYRRSTHRGERDYGRQLSAIALA